MNINPVGYNPQYKSQSCKQSPSFGAIRFTQDGIRALKVQILTRAKDADLFVKEIKPLIEHSVDNPIHVIVDSNQNITSPLTKLFAKVEDKKLNFGYDASETYHQDAKYSFDFLTAAVKKADQLNKINNDLNSISENVIK